MSSRFPVQTAGPARGLDDGTSSRITQPACHDPHSR
jgi:hypothetical protein